MATAKKAPAKKTAARKAPARKAAAKTATATTSKTLTNVRPSDEIDTAERFYMSRENDPAKAYKDGEYMDINEVTDAVVKSGKKDEVNVWKMTYVGRYSPESKLIKNDE